MGLLLSEHWPYFPSCQFTKQQGTGTLWITSLQGNQRGKHSFLQEKLEKFWERTLIFLGWVMCLCLEQSLSRQVGMEGWEGSRWKAHWLAHLGVHSAPIVRIVGTEMHRPLHPLPPPIPARSMAWRLISWRRGVVLSGPPHSKCPLSHRRITQAWLLEFLNDVLGWSFALSWCRLNPCYKKTPLYVWFKAGFGKKLQNSLGSFQS